jgi:hypothetical protein
VKTIAGQEGLVCAVMISRVCKLVRVLSLFVAVSPKFSVNPNINPKCMSDH